MIEQHTPLPWSVLDLETAIDICDEEGYAVAYCAKQLRSPEETKANARLIVHAVNSHAALLAAAKRVIREHGAPDTIFGIKALNAAIAAAEELK